MADKFNTEGYYDPTAHDALSAIEKEEKAARVFRPLTYICSPYAGDTASNILAAQKYCRYAVDKGYLPFAAHLFFPQFLNDEDPAERSLGISFGNVFMDMCAEIWIFGSEYSAGMQAEYDRATRKGYKIRCFTSDCREVGGTDYESLSGTCKRNY